VWGRVSDPFVIDACVHEQLVQCDILLCVSTNEVVILQAGNSEHWLLVELGVVKPVHRWIPPGPEVATHTPRRPVYLAIRTP